MPLDTFSGTWRYFEITQQGSASGGLAGIPGSWATGKFVKG
jgi:hypothetical protein